MTLGRVMPIGSVECGRVDDAAMNFEVELSGLDNQGWVRGHMNDECRYHFDATIRILHKIRLLTIRINRQIALSGKHAIDHIIQPQ